MNRFLDLNDVASQDGIFHPLNTPAPDDFPMLTMNPGRAEKKRIALISLNISVMFLSIKLPLKYVF